MIKVFHALAAMAAFSVIGSSVYLSSPVNAQTVGIRSSDAEMNAAIAEAQRTLPRFERVFREKSASSYSVKVKLSTRTGGNEHIWMDLAAIEGDNFRGAISNEPRDIPNMRLGTRHTANRSTITDWIYVKDGMMFGSYTIRVLLKHMPPEEAAGLQKRLSKEP